MRIAFVIAAGIALSACDEVVTPTAAYRPELAGTVDHALCLLDFTAVPVRKLITGHQLVDVTINGRPAALVVDTGANVSVLHRPVADRIGLKPAMGVRGAAIGLGGALSARQAQVEELKVGGVVIRQRQIMTADLSQLVGTLGRLSPSGVDGIIGQDVLKEHRAVIDVARPMLYLMEADRKPAPRGADACEARPVGGAAPTSSRAP